MAGCSRLPSPIRSATRSAYRPSPSAPSPRRTATTSAGRADLCALARPHLADPAWTLHEAARIGLKTIPWPKQYLSGKAAYETNLARAASGPATR